MFKEGWKARDVASEWAVGVGRRSGSSKSVVEVGRCRLCSKRAGIGRLNESRWTRSSLSKEVWKGGQNRQRGQERGWSGVVYAQRTGPAVVVQSGLEKWSSLSMEAGPVVGKGCQGRWSRSKRRAGMVVCCRRAPQGTQYYW